MDTEEFRNYIQRNVDHFKEEDEKRPFFEKMMDKIDSKRKIKNGIRQRI